MEYAILEALKEMEGRDYPDLAAARADHSSRELLDAWLNYEGIIGYTDAILHVVGTLCNVILEDAQ